MSQVNGDTADVRQNLTRLVRTPASWEAVPESLGRAFLFPAGSVPFLLDFPLKFSFGISRALCNQVAQSKCRRSRYPIRAQTTRAIDGCAPRVHKFAPETHPGDLSKAFACQRIPNGSCHLFALAGAFVIGNIFAVCSLHVKLLIIRRDYGTRRATHACQADRRGMRCCKVSRNAVRTRLRPARCKLTSLVHQPRVVFGSRCYYYRSGNNPIPSTPFKGGINQQAHPRVFHTRRKSDRGSGVSRDSSGGVSVVSLQTLLSTPPTV